MRPFPRKVSGGIVLNIEGRNSNVWIRRATLAHELAHILFDPEEQLSSVRVDSYEQVARDAEHDDQLPDNVEQRANAFAIEFLAPRNAVKQIVSDPAHVSAASVENVMLEFGIGKAAALFMWGMPGGDKPSFRLSQKFGWNRRMSRRRQRISPWTTSSRG